MLVLLVAGCAPRDNAAGGSAGGGGGGEGARIVVLSPALAVILKDMGLAGRVVGRHGYDRVLDPSIPVCGEQQAINYEALLRARPTHVLTEWGSRGLPGKLTDMAERDGWVLRDFRMLTLGDIDGAAQTLEGMFPGAEPDESIGRFHALVSGPAPEPVWAGRVMLLMGTSPVTALGPGSAHQELLERAGGVPAITEGAPAMTLHAEDVLRLAPDAIVLFRAGEGRQAGEAGMDALLGPAIMGLDIPAVREHRLAVIGDPLALLPSTRLVGVADALRGSLERWAGE